MSEWPMISFVATTVGESRIKQLERLLVSISHSAPSPRAEVILVFQSSSSEVPRAISELVRGYKYIKLIPSLPVSLSRARNIGLSHAAGEIVAFPDDDCWYPVGVIARVLSRFTASRIGGLCVRLIDPLAGRPLGRTRPPDVTFPVNTRNILQIPIGSCIFARRTAIETTSARFDERFGVGCRWGSGEDNDIVHQLIWGGLDVLYDGALSVYHENPVITPSAMRKSFRYGVGFGALACKFVRMRTLGHLPFVGEAIFRAAGGTVLSLLSGKWLRACFYMGRIAGVFTGALQGARVFLVKS
jgi:glycosyltransferase involved in cell wall biosynthesis